MSISAMFERLSLWPDLWRYPNLYVRVHGARDAEEDDLLTALLVEEVDDPKAAWRAILDEGDLAAVEAAYQQIGPTVGIDAARRDLETARLAFRRRSDALGDRALVLTAGRTAAENILNEARLTYLTSAGAAERLLATAAANISAAEREQLEHLGRIHLPADGDDSGHEGLADAIAAGDLRRALIFAGHLEPAVRPAHSPTYEMRFERRPTNQLIRWRLQPDLAPSWFPPIELADHDIALLMQLDAAQDASTFDAGEAETFTRIVLKFLGDGRASGGEIVRARARSPDTWSLLVRGEDVTDLFPFAVDEAGQVELAFPRSRSAPWPGGEDAGRFVGFDIFDNWRLSSRTGALISTPRMLLDLLGAPMNRGAAFVRLQSRQLPVRDLILHVLDRDLGRALRLAGAPIGGASSLHATDVLSPLLRTLDLYVDQADILAITDACGNRLKWLLPVLHAAARAADSAPPSHRRFDALNLLRRSVVQRELEVTFREELAASLSDTTLSCLVLDTAEDLFEDQVGGGQAGVAKSALAAAIVRRGYMSSVPDAEGEIGNLLQLGLLRNVDAVDGIETSDLILASLPLPARCLLGS